MRFIKIRKHNLNKRFFGIMAGCLVGFPLQAVSAVTVGDGMPAYFAHKDCSPKDTAQAEAVTQQPATAKKFVPKSAASIDFDPLHILKTQKRYLPKGKPFHTRKFYENLFFGVYTGFDKIVPRGGVGNDNGLPFGVFVGAHLSPLHTLRVSGYYSTWKLPYERYRMPQAGIDLDYLFDFTSYFFGYNPYRRFSLSGVLGIGGMKNSYYGDYHNIYKAQLGLNFRVAIGSNLHLFAEPYAAVTTGQLDVYKQPTNIDYDILYGIRAGLSVSLNRAKDYPRDSSYNGNLFFELSQGMNARVTRSMPLLRTMGTAYQVSVGKWFASPFGLRLSAAVADYYWTRSVKPATLGSPQYTTYFKGGFFEGRLEGLFHVLNFFPSMRTRDERPFDLNISLGGLYGWKVNTIVNQSAGLRCPYWGGTGALQLLYNADASTSLFVEPRVTYQVYSVPYNNANYDEKFDEGFIQLSLGVRVSRPLKRKRMLYQGSDFERELFVGGSLGGNKHMSVRNNIGDKCFNGQLSAHAGYHLFPYVGFRLGASYLHTAQNFQSSYKVKFQGVDKRFHALCKYNTGVLNLQLDYLFNFTNLYQGYNPDRKLNAYLTFGPGYSVCLHHGGKLYSKEPKIGSNLCLDKLNEAGEGGWSFSVGALLDYRVHPQWSVFVDPQVQYYFKRNFVGGGSTTALNDLFFKFSIGFSRFF